MTAVRTEYDQKTLFHCHGLLFRHRSRRELTTNLFTISSSHICLSISAHHCHAPDTSRLKKLCNLLFIEFDSIIICCFTVRTFHTFVRSVIQ